MIATLALLLVSDDRAPVTGFFDLPVAGGTATFEMLGLLPEERGHAIALLARELFTQSSTALARATAVRNFVSLLGQPGQPPQDANIQPVTIAVPLTADHWRDVLQVPDKGDLFSALISNRSAMLVCAGAMSTTPSTRAFLERDRGLLRWIVRTAPAAFWTSARSLNIERDRVIVPGGAAAEPVWEALAAEKVTRPADFVRALLTRDGGRLAWFFDAVGSMTPERAAMVFGPAAVATQIENARGWYAAFRSADSNWHLEEHPFLRGVHDPWMVSSQIAIEHGAVAAPSQQWLWEALFSRVEYDRKSAAAQRRGGDAAATLSWLTQQVTSATAKERRDRFEMIRFAQGVFPALRDDEWTDALIALSGFRRYKAVLITLDRMDVTAPRVYARVVESARQLHDQLSGRDERHAVIAFQAALAVLERARLSGAIDVSTAERMLLSLSDVVIPGTDARRETRPAQAITRWMLSTMMDALPPLLQPDRWTGSATAYESRLLQALAGAPSDSEAPVTRWEDLEYRVDWFAAEHARLKRIREQIESPGLDAAVASGDAEKISSALLALIYTPALGDPEGPALLGQDIAQRHDFGLVGPAGLRRESLAWAPPREQVGAGSPWHIEGSLLGLDIALARLALRRLVDNEMPLAPTINLNDQLNFARTALVLNPRDLTDADRDRIVAAIERGRERLNRAATNLDALMAIAAEVHLTAPVRETLAWTLTRTPDRVTSLFGLRDLLWLGQPDLPQATLDRWGVYAEALHSRARLAMPRPASWEHFAGRSDGGLIATQTPDLVLRLAQETARLRLPAQLVPGLLMYAVQDYWHDVESRFPDDWPSMARQALALSPARVEDYVAALAGNGPLRPH